MLLSLTTEWINLEEIIDVNRGFFVTGGDYVEYLLTSTTPTSTDKDRFFLE